MAVFSGFVMTTLLILSCIHIIELEPSTDTGDFVSGVIQRVALAGLGLFWQIILTLHETVGVDHMTRINWRLEEFFRDQQVSRPTFEFYKRS